MALLIPRKCFKCGWMFDAAAVSHEDAKNCTVPPHNREAGGGSAPCPGVGTPWAFSTDPLPEPPPVPPRDRQVVTAADVGPVPSGLLDTTRPRFTEGPPTIAHTPGPWSYEPAGDSDGETVGVDHFVMGDGGRVELACPPTEGDALLMAAAPKMYAAVQALRACLLSRCVMGGGRGYGMGVNANESAALKLADDVFAQIVGTLIPRSSEFEPVARLLAYGLTSAFSYFEQRAQTDETLAERILNTPAHDVEGLYDVARGLVDKMLKNPEKVQARLRDCLPM